MKCSAEVDLVYGNDQTEHRSVDDFKAPDEGRLITGCVFMVNRCAVLNNGYYMCRVYGA